MACPADCDDPHLRVSCRGVVDASPRPPGGHGLTPNWSSSCLLHSPETGASCMRVRHSPGMIAMALGAAMSPCMAQATLPVRHAVAGGVVDVGWPALSRVTVAPYFQYIGGQRFVLRGVADVEQHAFVVADSTRR